jgi:hypothetical protein
MKKCLKDLLIITAVFACIRFCIEYVFGLILDNSEKWMLVVFWFIILFASALYHIIVVNDR